MEVRTLGFLFPPHTVPGFYATFVPNPSIGVLRQTPDLGTLGPWHGLQERLWPWEGARVPELAAPLSCPQGRPAGTVPRTLQARLVGLERMECAWGQKGGPNHPRPQLRMAYGTCGYD